MSGPICQQIGPLQKRLKDATATLSNLLLAENMADQNPRDLSLKISNSIKKCTKYVETSKDLIAEWRNLCTKLTDPAAEEAKFAKVVTEKYQLQDNVFDSEECIAEAETVLSELSEKSSRASSPPAGRHENSKRSLENQDKLPKLTLP